MRLFNSTVTVILITVVMGCNKIAKVGDIPLADETHIQEQEAYVPIYKDENIRLKDFMKWYGSDECHLKRSSDAGELKYSLNYLPSECLSFLELRRHNFDFKEFSEIKHNYENMLYFNLKIELLGGHTELLKYKLEQPKDYEQRVKYISFEMEKDIYVVQGKDTVFPGLYQFERIFNVAPYSIVMLAFDGVALNRAEAMTIVYNDRLFGKGLIKFNYKKSQLTDLPTVTEL